VVERRHPPLPCAAGGLLHRLVAHAGELGVVMWDRFSNPSGRRSESPSHIPDQVEARRGVRLARLLHARSNEALEIFLFRHREISFVAVREPRPPAAKPSNEGFALPTREYAP